MRKLLILTVFMTLTSTAFAKDKPNCRPKYKEVSCADIEGAKRKFFCSRKEASEKRIKKVCMTEKKMRKKKSKK
jgi:hypothetical protein